MQEEVEVSTESWELQGRLNLAGIPQDAPR